MENYCLPENYNHRLNNAFFDDTPYTDQYQDEVYRQAAEIADDYVCFKVLDIGCGSGYKLMKYFGDHKTFGVEIEPTLSFLKNKYPDRQWGIIDQVTGSYDIAICSDVIEHIADPDEFIEGLLLIDFDMIIFSTPERNNMYGGETFGPPLNPAHVREWAFDEFAQYLGKYFDVKLHYIIAPNTQFAVCLKK